MTNTEKEQKIVDILVGSIFWKLTKANKLYRVTSVDFFEDTAKARYRYQGVYGFVEDDSGQEHGTSLEWRLKYYLADMPLLIKKVKNEISYYTDSPKSEFPKYSTAKDIQVVMKTFGIC